MRYFERTAPKPTLFVWDGTGEYIWHAERCIEECGNGKVFAVHAMPHETIHSHRTLRNNEHTERKLKRQFKNVVRRSAKLCKVQLDLVFGDRIAEIVRFAISMEVQTILIPRFSQSDFSIWIHGDLNERIEQQAPCPIVFLELPPWRDLPTTQLRHSLL